MADQFMERLDIALRTADYNISNPMLQELAEEGCAEAMFHLARRCLKGEGLERDVEKAVFLFTQALLTGGFWEDLARLWVEESDLTLSMKHRLFLYLAQKDKAENPHRLFFMGLIQEELSFGLALQYYKKAADLCQPDAMYRLGLYYRSRAMESEPADHYSSCAAAYFRRAADLGHEKAAMAFAMCCAEGFGTEQDHEKAFSYFNQARWEPLANYYLGYYRENGLGTAVDLKEAAYWYSEYLDCDFEEMSTPMSPLGTLVEFDGVKNTEYIPNAYLALGRCLLRLRKNDRRGSDTTPLKCFEKAAELGCGSEVEYEALYRCGLMHFFGIEVKVDMDYGLSCIQDAADHGYQSAREFLQECAAWETVPEALLEAGYADAQARQTEAILRLSILERKGVSPEIKKAFAEEGTPGYANDDCRGFDSFKESAVIDYDLIREAVETFERRNNTVYFIHGSLTMSYGFQASLFFVSGHPSEWMQERKDLLEEHPTVAVTNLTKKLTEVGRIGYIIDDSLMERRY